MSNKFRFTFLLYSVVFIFSSSVSYSQVLTTELQNPRGTNNYIRDIFFLNASLGWAVGVSGTVISTTDGGENWTEIQSGSDETLNTVFFLNSEIGFVGGSNGVFLRTLNGGKKWERIQLDQINVGHIQFLNSRVGYAVCYRGVYKTTDGGVSWSQLVLPPWNYGQNLNTGYFVNESVGFVGGNWDTFYKTSDGGNSWIKYSPITSVYDEIGDIYFINSLKGWTYFQAFVGKKYFYYSRYTTDGGKSWTDYNISGEIVKFIRFADDKNGFALTRAGSDYDLTGKFYYTSDGGANWLLRSTIDQFPRISSTERVVFNNIYNLEYTQDRMLFLAASTLLKSSDEGTNWTDQIKGVKEKLYKIHFGTENYGVAVGEAGTVLITRNKKDWNLIDLNTKTNFRSVYVVGDQNIWIGGENGTMLYSGDGGNSWTNQITNYPTIIRSIKFFDVNTGYAIGYGSYMIGTNDGGKTWYQIPTGRLDFYEDLSFLSPTTGWIAGGNGTVLFTSDGGAKWVNRSFSTTKSIYGLFFMNSKDGWVTGSNGFISRTWDGGVKWIEQNSTTENPILDIAFIDPNIGFAVGQNETFLHSSNGGSSWTKIFNPPLIWGTSGLWLYNLSIFDMKNIWITGTNGTIIKASYGESTGNNENLKEYTFNLSQNYPNPFNASTTLEFEIPEASEVSVTLFDILGREIKTLLNEFRTPGHYSLNITMNSLPSGVYLYRINAGKFSETKKMVLLK